MIIYTVKMANKESNRYSFIAYCHTHEVSVFLTWVAEDIFGDILFADVLVNTEKSSAFEVKFKKLITSKHIIENG